MEAQDVLTQMAEHLSNGAGAPVDEPF